MLNNLFSSFDTKNFMFFSYILVNAMFFKFLAKEMLINKISNILNFLIILIYKNVNNNFFFLNMFMLILILNFFSLNMFMFNLTSHFSLNLAMIFSLWIPILMLTLTKKNNNFFIHILPMGTMYILIPIMILIEFMSFFIRPLTLLLRLSINLIAGHVLVSLISMNILNNSMLYMFILYIYMIMKFLVSFIQSYIVITLINLYIEEIYVKY